MLSYPLGIREKSLIRYGAGDWEAITCPDWVKFLRVGIYGVGGNGGNGHSAAAAASRGGGGSGTNGNFSSIILPIHGILTRTFYLYLGAAGSGVASYLSIEPSNSQEYVIIKCDPGNAGANSVGSAGGAGGTVGTVNNLTQGLMNCLGIPYFRVSKAGQVGATSNGTGSAAVWGAGNLTTPGGSGGGVTSTDRAGGGQTGLAFTPTLSGGAAGSNNGPEGIYNLDGQFPYSLGGCGGGASNTGLGGNGGNGAPGSGGGGGGGGTTGGTGGLGGCAFASIIMG